MKLITVDEANSMLYECGLMIGEWGSMLPIDDDLSKSENWIGYQAPKNNLLNFSHHVSGWLHDSRWIIFQVDKSTGWIDPIQESLFGGLLFGANRLNGIDINDCRTLYVDFGGDKDTCNKNRLLVANLIYLFLLFELHCYVASSHDSACRYIGAQDGFVYLYTLGKDLDEAEVLVRKFEADVTAPPEWVARIIADGQAGSPNQ